MRSRSNIKKTISFQGIDGSDQWKGGSMMALPETVLIPFLFLMGAAFGSFLNVVIYRVPKKMSIISPSSHCFSCKQPISLKDNIPILGYFLLKGRCRSCEEPFPSRYAFVELITAMLTICVYLIYGMSQSFVIYLALTYLLIAITFVDIDHFIIPNGFVMFGLALLTVSLYLGLIDIEWGDAVTGSFVFAGFLFGIGVIGQFILKKESIGFGDVKLGLVLGGFLGTEYSILALYLSFALSAILVFVMMGGKLIKRDSKIPFGPYLAAGTLIALFTTTPYGGNYILNWYYTTMF
jgi:leader peptidase (prepilin peptidase)/N-methyltransferase